MKRIEEIMLIADMSWRNVWRNRRRSFFTFLTVAAGFAMIIFMRSLQNGGYQQMIEDSVSLNTGHIQIHEKGFWKNRTIEYAFQYDAEMTGAIRSISSVKGVAPRICAGALILHRESSAPGEIIAVKPELEKRVTALHRYILPGGRYLEDDDSTSILLGSALADNLGAKTGSVVSLLSQGFDGSISAGDFTVAGIFKCPDAGSNRGLAIIPFRQGADTFYMGEYISSMLVRVDDTDNVQDTLRRIERITGNELEVMSWDQLMPEILQFIAMDRVSSHIFVSILYMIVAFGILNTIQMSVFERTRELGIMLSIGTSPARVFMIVLTESFYISVIGIAAGIICGAALSFWFTLHPIDFSEYQAEMELYGMATLVYYAKLRIYDFIVTAAFTLTLSIIFTCFPARRAARLSPVSAIRHL